MKKIKLIIILFISLIYMNVNADYPNLGETTCSLNNSYYNAVEFGAGYDGSSPTKLIYDISYIEIVDDILNIYGWAFINGVDNTLGVDSFVNIVLDESTSEASLKNSEDLKFQITYANESNKSGNYKGLHYYDLTYWNCYRNGERKCESGSRVINKITKKASPILRGGFKASFDISKLPDNKKLQLYISVTSNNAAADASSDSGKWAKLAASQEAKSDTLLDYHSDNGTLDISVSGFGDYAIAVNNDGRLLSPDGLYCNNKTVPDSQAHLRKTTKIRSGEQYPIVDENSKMACRGYCNDNSYYEKIYAIKANVIPGTHVRRGNTTVYVAASWIQVSGNITISKKSKNIDPGYCDPNKGEIGQDASGTPFYNYYMFLSQMTKNDIDNGILSTSNSGGNSIYNDKQIFEQIFKNLERDVPDRVFENIVVKEIGSGKIDINSKNLEEFYKNLQTITKTSNKYALINNSYYITHTQWCENNNGTDSKCTPNNLTIGNINDYMKRSIYAKTTSITRNKNESGNGFKFIINRTFNKNLNFITKNGDSSGNLYNPAEYRVAYCILDKEKADCDDTVEQSYCQEDDVGTHAIFHEDDNLQKCTLDGSKNSGFTLLSNKYCEVACKDDFDIELPTHKFSAAGQYFVLNNYIPTVSVNRTCVTDKIDYSQFTTDELAARKTMIDAYNDYMDYYNYNEYLKNNISTSTSSGTHNYTVSIPVFGENCKTENGKRTCDGKEVIAYVNGRPVVGYTDEARSCSWEELAWEVKEYIGIAGGTKFDVKKGWEGTYEGKDDKSACRTNSSSNSRETYKKAISSSLTEKKKDYDTARTAYNSIFSNYEACSSWESGYELETSPDLVFDYPDVDGKIFGKDRKLDKEEVTDTSKSTYWDANSNPNAYYTTGGNSTKKETSIMKVDCTNSSVCGNSTGKSVNVITSSHIKRIEEKEYEYSLPQVYTRIPNGGVSLTKSDYRYIALEHNAAPISLSTLAGLYDYTFTLSNVTDKTRTNAENKDVDDFKERILGETGSNAILNNNDKYVCDYEVINDIYDPSPRKKNNKFFYRTVDMYDINPNDRVLGYNWSDFKAESVKKNMKKSAENVQNLDKYDVFEYTLTPAIMKDIRDYNKKQSNTGNGGYSDWDLLCEDNGKNDFYCKSNFLTCLTSEGKTKINNTFTSCNEIFKEGTLTNYKDFGYSLDELNSNRTKLINKLKSLGGTP